MYLLLPIDTHLHQRIYIPLASLFLLGCVVSSLSFGLRWRKSERGPEPKPIDVLLPSNRSWAANNICATHTRDFDPSLLDGSRRRRSSVLVLVQTAAKKLFRLGKECPKKFLVCDRSPCAVRVCLGS